MLLHAPAGMLGSQINMCSRMLLLKCMMSEHHVLLLAAVHHDVTVNIQHAAS